MTQISTLGFAYSRQRVLHFSKNFPLVILLRSAFHLEGHICRLGSGQVTSTHFLINALLMWFSVKLDDGIQHKNLRVFSVSTGEELISLTQKSQEGWDLQYT